MEDWEKIRKGIAEIRAASGKFCKPRRAQNSSLAGVMPGISRTQRNRLKRELEAMQQADHPNLLKVEDA